MNRAPKYTVSILCFNHRQLTENCLTSVFAHSGDDCEVFVTNNASSDDTASYLVQAKKKYGQRLTIITNRENKGFIDPNNHVLTLARGEFFVCLNNDMVVCKDWLTALSAPFAANSKLAITGAGGACNSLTSNWQAVRGPQTDYIEGSCLMIPTALARKHGLFAPYLKFIYWEDTDLSFRLQEQGYQIQQINLPIRHDHPSSTTKHMQLAEIKKANAEAFKSRWTFYIKRRSWERRILVRRLGARGDVLLATPIFKALRERYPQAEIHLQTKHPEMVRGIVSCASKGRKYYDDFIDLDVSYEKRPEVHIVQAYADAAGVTVPDRWNMEMMPTCEERQWALRKARMAKVALIHGGITTWPGKNWPVDRMTAVVGELRKQGYFTIAVGAEDTPDCGCDENVAGQTTPQGLFALAQQASLFVGLDSMPQHVASAADCPSVVLFGPTNPRCIVRPTPRIVAVQASREKADCVGAHGRRTKPITQSPCNGDCIRAIEVDDVLKAISRVQRLVPNLIKT